MIEHDDIDVLIDALSEAIPKDNTKVTAGDTDAILKERGSRYGKFKDHAFITQGLKTLSDGFVRSVHDMPITARLSASQLEALDMIYHKIGRILNGDPNYEDSWRDIAGYAQLVADELLGKEQ